MREIKFRGKLIISGNWAEGNLRVTKQEITIITPDETVLGRYGRVDKETVGQYTGLKDIKGQAIYEGDIVKKLIWNELKFESTGDGKDYSYAKVMYIEKLTGFYLVNKENKIRWRVADDINNIEVIGNIYDNKNLLEEE